MCSGNKLLEITPPALIFPFELGKKVSCSLQFSNKTQDHVAFKIKTTSPNKYSVSFNHWILPPLSKCNIIVAVKYPDILCEDKFLVQSVIVSKDALLEETAANMFKKEPEKMFDEVIVPVSFSPELISIEGTNTSPCPQEIEKELADAKDEIRKYKKLHGEMLNEIKKLKVTESLLASERERRTRLGKQLEAEKSEYENAKKFYYKKINELKDEASKKSNQCQEIEKELFDACIQLKETEDSLHAETKKRLQAEQQLANERNVLQNIQNSQLGMLEEIEGLKKQNTELQNERDKILRTFEDFRMWMEGLSSSSNRSMNNLTEFTYLELKEGTNDFDDSLKIGKGGYGSVYKGFLRHTTVAIKILNQESLHGDKEFNQEVEILSRVRHPNLLMLVGACVEVCALIYELMPNGSLHDLLRSKKRSKSLTWKQRICIASNICSGLIFLHSDKPHGIVHGDLKPANILLDLNYTAKISDFGLCRQLYQTDTRITAHHRTDNPKGTLPYMDPEYFHSAELTPQYDVYSFGIVLLELVTGKDAMGLRKLVEDAIQNEKLVKFVDASAGKWPFEEAKKMVLLGLRCSDPSRKNRPDLVKEVWNEIESMKHVALSH